MLVGDNKYYCDKCNRGVETLKRCCISNLPNTLLLHLKRFEFDYDNMKHVKINSVCEFPMSLNMEPYTREGNFHRILLDFILTFFLKDLPEKNLKMKVLKQIVL